MKFLFAGQTQNNSKMYFIQNIIKFKFLNDSDQNQYLILFKITRLV